MNEKENNLTLNNGENDLILNNEENEDHIEKAEILEKGFNEIEKQTKRIGEELERFKEIKIKEEEAVIDVQNLFKYYGNKDNPIVKNFSFRVKKGTIHGFIGPNGSGKTTIMNCILGLTTFDSGKIKVDNMDIVEDPNFNEKLGYMSAEPVFPPEITVSDYIKCCAYLSDIPQNELLTKFYNSKLSQFKDSYCYSLSTGWKKILQVFVMSICNSEILILDEPFNGLDPIFRFELVEHIMELRRKGASILISTHILSDLQKMADDITIIEKGNLLYTGPIPNDIERIYRFVYFKNVSEEQKTSFGN